MTTGELRKWENGARGDYVKEVVDYNFQFLNDRITKRSYSKTFTASDWRNGTIYIDYYEHRFESPIIQVTMLYNGNYVDVYGGYYTDSNNNVYLQSDIPFDGKVVIK